MFVLYVWCCLLICFFFFKQKTAYEMLRSLVGSEMCIRDRILGLLGIGWRYRRGWGRPGLLGLGYFLVMLLPVLGFLNIYFMRYSLVANHWQYFALIGPIALFAAGFTRAGRSMSAAAGRAGWPRVSAFGFSLSAFGLVLALGVLTGREAATYKNLKTLWTTTLARNPAAGLAHNNLGTLLLEEGRPAEAEAHFRQALALQPKAADEAIASRKSLKLIIAGIPDQDIGGIVALDDVILGSPEDRFKHST